MIEYWAGTCDKCGQDVYAYEDGSYEWCYYCEESRGAGTMKMTRNELFKWAKM